MPSLRLLTGALLIGLTVPAGAVDECTYTTYKWNVPERRAVDFQTVSKPYSQLVDHEIDPATGCSICEQDQVRIALPGIEAFRLCRRIAGRVEQTLLELVDRGAPIHSITGYRVGKTRGDTDRHGNRTRYSNHAFGIALDINPEANGLYDRCPRFGPGCRLIKGGRWDPARPASLTADGPIVRALKNIGLRWGGQIKGRQKDFMHFSPTGY